MPSPRWLAGLVIPTVAAAAIVANAQIANADPTSDGYLAQLRGAGFSWPPNDDDAIIGMAQLICADLASNWAPARVAQDIHANLDSRGVTLGQVNSMVDLAHSTYCPNFTVLR